MNRKARAICASLLAVGIFFPSADAGNLVRLSAQFRRFDGGLDSTTAAPSATPGTGGIPVYTKSFNVPAPPRGQRAVVFITMEALGDTADNAIAFSCEIDGAFCNPGNTFTVPSGWIVLGFHSPDELAAPVSYTWCAKVSPGPHTASIRMASRDGPAVNLFSGHFYIDRTTLKKSTPNDCELGAP